MTDIELYQNLQYELEKTQTPTLLLDEFNYYATKAIRLFVDEIYNSYDTTQHSSDDLQNLKVRESISGTDVKIFNSLAGKAFALPENYLHLLEVTLHYATARNCDNKSIAYKCRRLTDDKNVLTNTRLQPSYNNPYYYIYNNVGGVAPNLEIRYNVLPQYLILDKISYTYLKQPKEINITENNLSLGLSEEMEWNDNISQRILTKLVSLILERNSDPRVQTNMPINTVLPNKMN